MISSCFWTLKIKRQKLIQNNSGADEYTFLSFIIQFVCYGCSYINILQNYMKRQMQKSVNASTSKTRLRQRKTRLRQRPRKHWQYRTREGVQWRRDPITEWIHKSWTKNDNGDENKLIFMPFRAAGVIVAWGHATPRIIRNKTGARSRKRRRKHRPCKQK